MALAGKPMGDVCESAWDTWFFWRDLLKNANFFGALCDSDRYKGGGFRSVVAEVNRVTQARRNWATCRRSLRLVFFAGFRPFLVGVRTKPVERA